LQFQKLHFLKSEVDVIVGFLVEVGVRELVGGFEIHGDIKIIYILGLTHLPQL
jgi:hypothetical protein